jgi:2-oxoglutarate ferredoxin oxidoreductase subunit delta
LKHAKHRKKKTGSKFGFRCYTSQKTETEQRTGVDEGPSHIDVFREWCRVAAFCVAFFPKQVLALDETAILTRRTRGLFQCGMCEMRCPDFAISVVGKKTGLRWRID